jgi:hypothetical protein
MECEEPGRGTGFFKRIMLLERGDTFLTSAGLIELTAPEGSHFISAPSLEKSCDAFWETRIQNANARGILI